MDMSDVSAPAPPAPPTAPTGIGRLELRHLHALRAVAETGSFGRAAEHLGYTQSAISQQVAALEQAIGQKVFDRPGGPRPVVLTPAGELLLERAGEILDRVAIALADVSQIANGERGTIRMGTFQSASVHLVPPIMRRLHDLRPLVTLEPHEVDDDDELVARVRSGELDMAFLVCGDEGPPADLGAVPLFRDPYVVMVPPDEPEGPFPTADLQRRPVIGSLDSICERIVAEGLAAQAVAPDYRFHTSDNAAVHAMVRNGMGVAVMPRLAVDFSDTTVATRPMDPPVRPRTVLLVHRREAAGPLVPLICGIAEEVVADLGLGRDV
jgi:DNA-binding transcriptional LysR family regulator